MHFFRGIILFASFVVISSAQKNVICSFDGLATYLYGFDIKSDIDPNLCTHIIFDYVVLGHDNKVTIVDSHDPDTIKQLVDVKSQNSNLKILVSMGEWREESGKYSKMAADANARKTFVQSVVQFLDQYKLDGFDLMWRYPGQREGSNPSEDPANFVLLLKELKAALSPKNKLLSIAVDSGVKSMDISYPDVKAVSNNVDFINILTIDMALRTDQPVAYHHSPLYASNKDKTEEQKNRNIAASVQHWLSKGCDPKKLNIVIAAYGFNWSLTDPNKHDIYDPVENDVANGIEYNKICQFQKDWLETFDNEQKVPHKYSGKHWIAYDNVQSVTSKAQFAKDIGLGGVMIMTVDFDDFKGNCDGAKYPLIGAIKKVLYN